MGKTYKKYVRGYHRSPRGHKQAIINGARKGAIPPDAWDDVNHDPQVYIPYRVASKLHKQGFADEEIIRRIRRKFHYTHAEAADLIPNYGWYDCDCRECVCKY